jgi:hypothetical protein
MAQHPTLSVDCAISGAGGTGTGVVTLRRPVGVGEKVEWKSKLDGVEFRFTTDGSMGIEVLPSESVYDRILTIGRPFPGGRINGLFGFPYPIVAGSTPFFGAANNTKLSRKGALTELVLSVHTVQGDTVIVGDFAADGRLMHYDAGKGPAGHLKHEIVDLSNYRFGADAVPSSFDTKPPIGFSAYAFDIPPEVLPGMQALPNVPLTGASVTTLAKLGNQPKLLIAFVDDPLPDGLVASLARLSNETPVAAIALKGAEVSVGNVPLYRADDAGFDAAGIRATPQFYFVSSGKVVQAWSGFKESAAAKFEAEVLNFAQKH